MSFRLIETGWKAEIAQALAAQSKDVCILCPFIKLRVAEEILSAADGRSLRIITRFNLQDFAAGVSDISALQALMTLGARVRGIRDLHSKLYIFGRERILLTSANLTYSGLTSNHEYGCTSDESEVVESCTRHYESKWHRAATVTTAQLIEWQTAVSEAQIGGGQLRAHGTLPDYGAQLSDVSHSTPAELGATPISVLEARRAFVKFSGTSSQRADRSTSVLEAVRHSATDSVLSYPRGKRPRQVQDGDIMFIGRLVSEPDDLMIYGRAIGIKHDERRDVATTAELEERPWRANWPNYIRVHHGEFIDASLGDGVSLKALMAELGHLSFASTLRNFETSSGNLEPSKAYSQQPSVELSPHGTEWLTLRLEQAFDYFGKISKAKLQR